MVKDVRKPLGIYVHIPFCARKCNYCDFLSWNKSEDMQKEYMRALVKEIKMGSDEFSNFCVDTIYIGGGTPSIVDSALIIDVLECIYNNYSLNDKTEITIEVNPGTLNVEKIKDYKNIGINRVSMGLQSTVNEELRLLGRIHTYEEFLENYETIRSVGIDNISIDLMFAIPNQTIDSYEKSLRRIVDLRPNHISSYSLIIEEGTRFYKDIDKLKLVSEDDERKMYYITNQILKEKGYNRYEISNYALDGMESRHNSSYWTGIDYIGFGLGASSYVNGIRFDKVRDIDKYINYFKKYKSGEGNNGYEKNKDSIICNRQNLSVEEKMEEFMFLGLRMTKGIGVDEFKNRFSKDIFNVYGEVINKYTNMDFMKFNKDRVYLTEKGLDVSNVIFSDFLI